MKTTHTAAWTVALAALVASAAAAQVPNPGFEDGGPGKVAGWKTETWNGKAATGPVDGGRSGARAVQVESKESGADAAWTTKVAVRPFARHRISAWVKVDGVEPAGGAGAGLNLHGRSEKSAMLTGTKDWTEVSLEFDSGADDAVQLNCILGFMGLAKGRARFDDVRIEMLEARPIEAGGISIDAAQKGEPMSPLIYGQFIEHLGRCIYGGIWAEMLEDRKFHYVLTPDFAPYGAGKAPSAEIPFPVVSASPWQIVAGVGDPSAAVTMATNDIFTGRHVPRLAAGAAIRQGDLAVEKDRDYEGYLWVRGEGASTRVSVSLEGAKGGLTGAAASGRDYVRLPFTFRGTADVARATLTVRLDGAPGRVGTVSLMPADNVEGLRADTLALLRELRSPIYRWPGGNFVSGYDWRDGIGDRDRRPPRVNPAWTGVEHNDFGMHEFIRFCRLVEAEPLITVNTGFGDAHSAAAELEYANGAADTPWGRKRAQNGARQPFGVKYWCVGNEMWGPWQLGFMKAEHYYIKHNWVVDTMRQVDPSFIPIASGNIGPWSEGLLRECAGRMDLIAEHFYCQERPGVLGHVRQITDAIRRKADAHRDYRARIDSLKGRDIRIAMTEWNYWYGPHPFGELGTRYFLKDGLGIAAGLHEYARQSDIIGAAFYAQTVNVIGCIKTSRTRAALETTGLALKLYRDHFLGTPLKTATGPLIDAQAMLSPDGRHLVLGIVNPQDSALEIPLALAGVTAAGPAESWRIAGKDPMAFNDPDAPATIAIEALGKRDLGATLRLAPYSATVLRVPVKP